MSVCSTCFAFRQVNCGDDYDVMTLLAPCGHVPAPAREPKPTVDRAAILRKVLELRARWLARREYREVRR